MNIHMGFGEVRQKYQEAVATGAWAPDADQKHAIDRLAYLDFSIPKPSKKSFLSWRQPSVSPMLSKQGAYLYGDVGRGKTRVMDLFFQMAPLKKKRRVHFHAFMIEVHDFLHRCRQDRQSVAALNDHLLMCARHVAAEARLLCFDEFQVKDVADAMILGRLFTALFQHDVIIVITSNIPPDELYWDGLQRDRFLPFIALLKEKLELLPFHGEKDYRLGRLRAVKTYYWPHDADIRAELWASFMAFSDGQGIESVNFAVKERTLHVPYAVRQAAWFDFYTLFEEARSAIDYLYLVSSFKIFFIENVPLMNDDNHNAVMRFITFIDTAYDHRCRLIISAAAAPENLYTGVRHAQAFPRTISRLREMQSQDYGDSL